MDIFDKDKNLSPINFERPDIKNPQTSKRQIFDIDYEDSPKEMNNIFEEEESFNKIKNIKPANFIKLQNSEENDNIKLPLSHNQESPIYNSEDENLSKKSAASKENKNKDDLNPKFDKPKIKIRNKFICHKNIERTTKIKKGRPKKGIIRHNARHTKYSGDNVLKVLNVSLHKAIHETLNQIYKEENLKGNINVPFFEKLVLKATTIKIKEATEIYNSTVEEKYKKFKPTNKKNLKDKKRNQSIEFQQSNIKLIDKINKKKSFFVETILFLSVKICDFYKVLKDGCNNGCLSDLAYHYFTKNYHRIEKEKIDKQSEEYKYKFKYIFDNFENLLLKRSPRDNIIK